MIGEKYLGRQAAEDLYYASMLTASMTEKQAAELFGLMEKDAFGFADALSWLKGVGSKAIGGIGLMSGALGKGVEYAAKIPPALAWTALLGSSAGVIGSMGYDVMKERLAGDDPEAKYNSDVEAIYKSKNRERDDAAWMAKARNKRDDIKRRLKKMTPKDYSREYNELMDILNERKA